MDRGVMDRLLTSPTSRGALMVSTLVYQFVLTVLQTVDPADEEDAIPRRVIDGPSRPGVTMPASALPPPTSTSTSTSGARSGSASAAGLWAAPVVAVAGGVVAQLLERPASWTAVAVGGVLALALAFRSAAVARRSVAALEELGRAGTAGDFTRVAETDGTASPGWCATLPSGIASNPLVAIQMQRPSAKTGSLVTYVATREEALAVLAKQQAA